MRINTILHEDTVFELDVMAGELHKSRSELLREAAEHLLSEYREKRENERKQVRMREAVVMQDRIRERSGNWDGVAEVRKWREVKK